MTAIYTDGSCKGNGKTGGKTSENTGGFGVYICYDDGSHKEIWGGERATTNNRMELMAIITALECSQNLDNITLYSDSTYVINGITKWINGWKNKNWHNVKNSDLWQRLDDLYQTRRGRNQSTTWQWVKGHSDNVGNIKADELANKGINSTGSQFYDKDKHPLPQQIEADTMINHPNNRANFDEINQIINKANDEPLMEDLLVNADTPNSVSGEQSQAYDGDTSRYNPGFVPILPKPINKNLPKRQLIMDTETTGLNDQGGDRIVEVGIIEMIDRKLTGEKLHVYINPKRQMDDEVIRVHGISNEFLVDKPTFDKVAKQIYDFMVGSEIVAHNAHFDVRFLQMEFDKVGLSDFDQNVSVVDTLALAKQKYPGQKNSLDALVKRLNVGNKDRTFHGALLDSEILAEVYLAMTGGQVALAIDNNSNKEDIAQHENMATLGHLLVRSVDNPNADSTWREQTL